MKVLLAVDGSDDTKKMLAYLTTHEDLLGAKPQFVVLNVQPAIPSRAAKVAGKEMVDEFHRAEAELVLAPVAKFLVRHEIHAKSEWKVGPAGETIAKFADEGKFDLLVMGSHGNGALGNLVMGSVATKVLAQCTVPVLMVR